MLAPRKAMAADVPALVALINAAFAIEKAFVDGERTSNDEVAALMQKGVFLIVDGADGVPMACAYVEQRGDRAYHGMLSIDPAKQGQGLGRQMMDVVEHYCRGRRVRSLDINILNLRPELPPFYRKLGFVEDGTAPYENPKISQPAHFLRMTKKIA